MVQSSPFVGTVFSGSPQIEINGLPFDIPAHSDWLDIVAFGGILGLVLLGAPAGYVIWKTTKKITFVGDSSGSKAFIVFCLFYGVLAFVAMVVNPIMSVPYLSFWLWFSLGTMLAYVNIHFGKLKTMQDS